MRRLSLRKLSALVALLLTASTLFVTPTAQAQGPVRDFGAESGFLASLNAQRAGAGLGPLTLNGSMTAAADSWAFTMASGSFLAHAGDIVSGTPAGWTKVGENVGRGQSVTSLTSAFMASPGHRANIMDPTYTHVGIAVYSHPSDGRIYTTHRFAALGGAAPVAAPAAPTAAPTTAPPPPPPTAVPTLEPTAPPPTAVPTLEPTPIPPTAVPTLEPTPIPPTATPVPPAPTPEPTATPVPPTPTPEPTQVESAELDVPDDDAGFGLPPEQLAFVDSEEMDAARAAKLASKTAKLGR